MSEKTREQIEAELEDLRADLERAEAAEAVIRELEDKHGYRHISMSLTLKNLIFQAEVEIDPTILAVSYAKSIVGMVDAIPHSSRPSPAQLALAKAYLESRGESVDAE